MGAGAGIKSLKSTTVPQECSNCIFFFRSLQCRFPFYYFQYFSNRLLVVVVMVVVLVTNMLTIISDKELLLLDSTKLDKGLVL